MNDDVIEDLLVTTLADPRRALSVSPGLAPAVTARAHAARRRWRAGQAGMTLVLVAAMASTALAVTGIRHADVLQTAGAPGQSRVTSTGGPGPLVALVSSGGINEFHDTDALLPSAPDDLAPPAPGSAPCTASGLTGTLRLSGTDGLMALTGRPSTSCQSPPDESPSVRLLDAQGRTVSQSRGVVQEPLRDSPPALPYVAGFFAGARTEIHASLAFPDGCSPSATSAVLVGLTVDPIPLQMQGGLPACSGRQDAQPVLGLLHGMGEPGAVVPADRAHLRLSVTTPDTLVAGKAAEVQFRLRNTGDKPVSLSPCPTWRVRSDTERTDGWSGRTPWFDDHGRFPCEALPESIEPGQEVAFRAQELLGGSPDPGEKAPRRISDNWTVSGVPEAHSEHTLVQPPPPTPVADVPWAKTPVPPGKAQVGIKVGASLPYAVLRPTFETLPATVQPGSVLSYTVRLTNQAPGRGVSIPLDPCPGFVQAMQAAGGQTVVDEHYLNCAAAPGSLRAGDALLLHMQLAVPADTPTGRLNLTWKIGKLDMYGSASATAAVEVS